MPISLLNYDAGFEMEGLVLAIGSITPLALFALARQVKHGKLVPRGGADANTGEPPAPTRQQLIIHYRNLVIKDLKKSGSARIPIRHVTKPRIVGRVVMWYDCDNNSVETTYVLLEFNLVGDTITKTDVTAQYNPELHARYMRDWYVKDDAHASTPVFLVNMVDAVREKLAAPGTEVVKSSRLGV